MQINVVHDGNDAAIDMLLFPDQNPINTQYIQQQLSMYSDTLTDIGRRFVETSKEIYQKVNDSNAIRLAKSVIRMAKGVFHPNTIVPLETIEDLRIAQPIMQRYIMAEPTIRELYQKQLCDGFSDTYADIEAGSLRDDHYDYRRVMTGIIQEDGDSWVARQFHDDSYPEDVDLTFDERMDILVTWDKVKEAISQGQDPTSIYGSKLSS